MRNLLEEFHKKHGLRPPTILGVREHVFTGRFGWFLFKHNDCSVFVFFRLTIVLYVFLQCLIVSVVYVKSRNQLCDLGATCLGESSQVSCTLFNFNGKKTVFKDYFNIK